MRRKRVHVVTMGCAKNLVDSEKLKAQLRLNQIELAPSIRDADVAIINTCGFIGPAKEESIDMIMEHVRLKEQGALKKVYAIGCLTERYREELAREIPEVDRFFGSNHPEEVLRELGAVLKHELLGERELTSPTHVAYLKISEGCDNPCSFCAIPSMRGSHVSRPLEEIIAEARLLAEKGVKELVVIGQDTTYYGLDRYGRRRIAGLLEQLAGVDGIQWLRLMYAYPAKFPLEVLDVIAGHPRVCKYLDLPVQHASDAVLRSMRRGISGRSLRELLATIRERVPGIALRSTVIVGYPTETQKEFEELLEFVTEIRFDRLGVFAYSQEDGTTAFPLGDPVRPREKEERRARVMEAQQAISLERNRLLVGTRQKVIIDGREGRVFTGRTERDAPEIDNGVLITASQELVPGSFHHVDIVGASHYDIHGRA